MCLRILTLGLLNLLWIGSLQANPLFEDTSPGKQYDKAYALYKKMEDVNTPLSPFEDLARVVVGVLQNKDYTKAYQLYEKMNDGGSAAGATGLGDLYFSGLGVEQDYSKAKFYYELAREHYKKEDEITHDYMLAPKRYKQNAGKVITGLGNADDLGFMHASFQLARMATLGLGMPKDFKKAFKFYEDVLWFPDCAQIFGSYRYGLLKENFSLLEYYNDYNRYWLVKEYGSHSNIFDVVGDFTRTFYELGKMYQQGLGTHKNAKKALAYFKKAAELGSQEAILALKKQEKH